MRRVIEFVKKQMYSWLLYLLYPSLVIIPIAILRVLYCEKDIWNLRNPRVPDGIKTLVTIWLFFVIVLLPAFGQAFFGLIEWAQKRQGTIEKKVIFKIRLEIFFAAFILSIIAQAIFLYRGLVILAIIELIGLIIFIALIFNGETDAAIIKSFPARYEELLSREYVKNPSQQMSLETQLRMIEAIRQKQSKPKVIEEKPLSLITCTTCGKQNPNDSLHCNYCGKSL